MATQICEYTENHWTLYFKLVNCKVSEFSQENFKTMYKIHNKVRTIFSSITYLGVTM